MTRLLLGVSLALAVFVGVPFIAPSVESTSRVTSPGDAASGASLPVPLVGSAVRAGGPPQFGPSTAATTGLDTNVGRSARTIIRNGHWVIFGHNPATVVAAEPYEPPVLAACERIASAMRAQGFSEAAVAVGAGIVMAESGGRAEATNVSEVERSIGPWQVNTLVHRAWSDECLRSLLCSTAVAYRLSAAGTRWTPWSTYTSGAWDGRCG